MGVACELGNVAPQVQGRALDPATWDIVDTKTLPFWPPIDAPTDYWIVTMGEQPVDVSCSTFDRTATCQPLIRDAVYGCCAAAPPAQ